MRESTKKNFLKFRTESYRTGLFLQHSTILKYIHIRMTFKPQTVPHIIPNINDEDWRNDNHIQIRRMMIREM
jgi:hypothetical protein